MNIYFIDLIDINLCSDSEIYENENTFTASDALHQLVGILGLSFFVGVGNYGFDEHAHEVNCQWGHYRGLERMNWGKCTVHVTTFDYWSSKSNKTTNKLI